MSLRPIGSLTIKLYLYLLYKCRIWVQITSSEWGSTIVSMSIAIHNRQWTCNWQWLIIEQWAYWIHHLSCSSIYPSFWSSLWLQVVLCHFWLSLWNYLQLQAIHFCEHSILWRKPMKKLFHFFFIGLIYQDLLFPSPSTWRFSIRMSDHREQLPPFCFFRNLLVIASKGGFISSPNYYCVLQLMVLFWHCFAGIRANNNTSSPQVTSFIQYLIVAACMPLNHFSFEIWNPR